MMIFAPHTFPEVALLVVEVPVVTVIELVGKPAWRRGQGIGGGRRHFGEGIDAARIGGHRRVTDAAAHRRHRGAGHRRAAAIQHAPADHLAAAGGINIIVA